MSRHSFVDSLTLPAAFVIFYFQVYKVCESTVLKKEIYLEILMDLHDGTVVLYAIRMYVLIS